MGSSLLTVILTFTVPKCFILLGVYKSEEKNQEKAETDQTSGLMGVEYEGSSN